MRKIGTFPDRRAEQFANFLTAQGIPSQAIANGQIYDLWVVDEDHLEEAKQLFETFQQAPDDPAYAKSGRKAEAVRKQELARKVRTRRLVRTGEETFAWRTPVTMGCLLICVVLAFAMEFRFDVNSRVVQLLEFNYLPWEAAIEQGLFPVEAIPELNAGPYSGSLKMRAASLLRGEMWRMITPAFMHMDLRHLIFNMIVLFSFGRRIEWIEGRWFMVGLVLAAAIVPNLLQGLVPASWDGTAFSVGGQPPAFHAAFAGFSGVDFAIFSFIWLRGLQRFVPEYQLTQFTVIIFLAVLLIGVAGQDALIFGHHMANWGHGGGLAVGLLAAVSPFGRSARRGR